MATDLTLLSRVSYRDKEITGPRMRGLFALLAGDLRVGCSTSRLVDELWWDERPGNPAKALQILVSRARTQLGAGLIASTPAGYRLAIGEDQVDTSSVLLSAAISAQCLREGDHAAALRHAESGLALWDGAEPGDPGSTDPLSTLRAERMATYRSLARIRALALSRLGRHDEALGGLEEVFAERPRDEEALLELLRCEAATAGPSAAIARYDAYRRSLRAELGTDPSRHLQNMHQQLLRGAEPEVRSGVPFEPNVLVGRDDDITAVMGMLRASRVTSIVGAGGLGKTRLAYAVSRRAEQRAVYLVALAGVGTDEDVAGAVASALGVADASPSPLTGVVNALGRSPALLVLDNCEHVVRGAAELVQALVSTSADLRVLTTSRAPLGLSSESVYPLPELSLAASVELFTQRAKAARPTADLPESAVEAVCRKLDGLPLAVELAAAHVRVMSVAAIAARLENGFALLRSGARDSPERHRTLQAVIGWSWNLLSPDGRAAMRALSVFPAGFTAEAAEHLIKTGDVLDTLTLLTDQSLLKVVDTPSGVRFRMLETVREFSAAQREPGEAEEVTTRFLEWARDFGITHHESLFGEDPATFAGLIRAEQDNLNLALRLALDRDDGPAVAAATAALGGLWGFESNFARLTWLTAQVEPLMSHFRPHPDHLGVTRMAVALCVTYTFMLREPRATRSLHTLRRLPPGPPSTLAGAIQAVALAPDISRLCDSDEPLLAWTANCVESFRHQRAGDVEQALVSAERVHEAAEQVRLPFAVTLAHSRIGELCLDAEQGDRARRHFAAIMPLLNDIGTFSAAPRLRWALAMACLQVGDVDAAEQWAEEASLPGDESDTVSQAMRAEILLARGQAEAGLRAWRRVADRVHTTEDLARGIEQATQEAWFLESQAAAVVAHAQYDRLDMVRDISTRIPALLSDILRNRSSTPYFPVYGSLLLALGMTDIVAGRSRRGAQLVALAESFRFSRGFQPTMSPVRAREAAERADRAAYTEAQSAYAGLDPDGLRTAALTVLTGLDHA